MTVNLSPVGGAAAQFFDNNGNPLLGGKIFTYLAGTTTPVTTYTTSVGNIAHTNPIILDSAGRVPSGGEIWLTTAQSYKFILRTSADVLIGTYDNIPAINDVNAADIVYTPAGANAVPTTVEAKLRQYVSLPDYTSLRNALATGLRVQIPSSTTSISVSTADSPSVLPYLYLIDCQAPLTIALATGVHTTTLGNIVNVGQNQDISISGATPTTTTITSIDSVSGSAGNWVVTATLASAAGVAINNVVKIDDVIPGKVYFPTTVGDRRPAANEMAIGIYAMGECTTSGTTVSLTKSVAGSFLVSGDLVTIRGETRVVDVVGTNSFTVTSAFEYDVSSYQWWYYHIPNAGTITATASTTVTGTSTTFLTNANVGDLLVVDGCSYKIDAVVDN
jgi:hypothetical protein